MLFFFNDTATTEIYTLSLHDALPIWIVTMMTGRMGEARHPGFGWEGPLYKPPGRDLGDENFPPESICWYVTYETEGERRDRKSTRLNSSHANISYAVFCLKKKNNCTI